MSTSKAVTVWCDQAGCQEWYCGDEPTTREARAEARKRGWRYIPGHPAQPEKARDLCPKHPGGAS